MLNEIPWKATHRKKILAATLRRIVTGCFIRLIARSLRQGG
jgi:hypothetical protein